LAANWTIEGRDVAVKILRPGVERRFASDIESFAFAARNLERFIPAARRLRPAAAVAVLDMSMKLELDLRMEAAAMSEMAENTKGDPGFRVPCVDWQRTGKQVLTLEWIDGTPMNDVEALRGRGLDLIALGDTVIQSFLRHAIRDGFFHADMHQGNLFVDKAGLLVPVDYGIMGRLGPKEGLFLAQILYGFITRDYAMVSRVHFDAGYVPESRSEHDFAQAIRAIGEPILGKAAADISMARLLTQLFEVTGQFDMATQPQLLLLQKTMVVVEGVARTLNPDLNIWASAEPVVRPVIERRLGPIGKMEGAAGGVFEMGAALAGLPGMLSQAQRATAMLADMAKEGGVKLDRATLAALATEQARQTRWTRYALVAGAAALVVMAVRLIG
jgi:ubiquinone biosynthesis protein